MSLERRVAQVARGELEGRDVELSEQVRAFEVEGGGEQHDSGLARMPLQHAVLVGVELERFAMLAVRPSEAQFVLVRLLVELSGEERPI